MGSNTSRDGHPHAPSLEEIGSRPTLAPHEVASLPLVPHYVYAVLAEHVYNETLSTPLPTGWQLLMSTTTQNMDREGFYAAAYVNKKLKHCVIAIRGTSEVLGLRAGVWMYFEEPTIQFFLAEQFSNQVQQHLELTCELNDPWFVSYTGHSLGAVVAACRAVEEGTYAITFESPGCRAFLDKTMPQRGDGDTSVITYLRSPNPINTLKPHSGYLVEMPIPLPMPSGLILPPPVVVDMAAAASAAPPTAAENTASPPASRSPPAPNTTVATPTAPDAGHPTPPAAAGPTFTQNIFNAARLRIPSIRPQEYIRGRVLSGMGIGIPELQQYLSRIEPTVRELLEHTQQVHSIHGIVQHFAKDDEPAGECVVLHWPAHLMQFLEYHNTLRALEDPDTSKYHRVRRAYETMQRRLYATTPRHRHRLPLRYINADSQLLLRLWWRLGPARLRECPLSMLEHKALNVMTIENDVLCTEVITAFQAKQLLAIIVVRPGIRILIQRWGAVNAPLPTSNL